MKTITIKQRYRLTSNEIIEAFKIEHLRMKIDQVLAGIDNTLIINGEGLFEDYDYGYLPLKLAETYTISQGDYEDLIYNDEVHKLYYSIMRRFGNLLQGGTYCLDIRNYDGAIHFALRRILK